MRNTDHIYILIKKNCQKNACVTPIGGKNKQMQKNVHKEGT